MIYLILDSDWVEYTLYYTLPKFYCTTPYGGGAIRIVVVARRGCFRDGTENFGRSLYVAIVSIDRNSISVFRKGHHKRLRVRNPKAPALSKVAANPLLFRSCDQITIRNDTYLDCQSTRIIQTTGTADLTVGRRLLGRSNFWKPLSRNCERIWWIPKRYGFAKRLCHRGGWLQSSTWYNTILMKSNGKVPYFNAVRRTQKLSIDRSNRLTIPATTARRPLLTLLEPDSIQVSLQHFLD